MASALPQSSLAQPAIPAPIPYGAVAPAPATEVAYAPPPAPRATYAWQPASRATYSPPPASRVAYTRPTVTRVAYAPPPTRGTPASRNFFISSASAATIRPAMATGRWGIQVGAYDNPEQARRMAESVRVLAPVQLGGARAVLGTTAPFGGHVLYRARLLGLSAQTASAACGSLQAHAQACVTVPPGG
jgi:D-alanyl-D-alanine carboxypeptidase